MEPIEHSQCKCHKIFEIFFKNLYSCGFTNLIDSARIGHRIGMLDDGYRFAGQDRLINPQSGREDFAETNICRDFVADRHLHDVTGHDLFGPDPLDAGFVPSYNLTHLRLVLLERLYRRLGVPFLPDTDYGIGDENEQDNKGFDEGRECILVLFK